MSKPRRKAYLLDEVVGNFKLPEGVKPGVDMEYVPVQKGPLSYSAEVNRNGDYPEGTLFSKLMVEVAVPMEFIVVESDYSYLAILHEESNENDKTIKLIVIEDIAEDLVKTREVDINVAVKIEEKWWTRFISDKGDQYFTYVKEYNYKKLYFGRKRKDRAGEEFLREKDFIIHGVNPRNKNLKFFKHLLTGSIEKERLNENITFLKWDGYNFQTHYSKGNAVYLLF